MPNYALVPDPTFTGEGAAPEVPRSLAMRLLYDEGHQVGDIARRYGIPYGRAYKAIFYKSAISVLNRLPHADANGSTEPVEAKALKPLEEMSIAELKRVATKRGKVDERTQKANELLEAKDPNWFDELPK